MKRCLSAEHGFSLIEALVATGILTMSLVSLAQLFGTAIDSNIASRTTTYTTVLARQKIEQLRALEWGIGLDGLPVSDTTTDTAFVPPRSGGTGLSPSPANALTASTPGFVDYADQSGDTLGGGAEAAAGAVYTRRWSIDRLPASPDTLVIQVRVTRSVAPGTAANRVADEARLIAVRTRRPM